MNRPRLFPLRTFFAALAAACFMAAFDGIAWADANRLNILLITADDMNYDTPGFAGGKTPDITPNLDRLASQGIRFVQAHVTVAVCQPSRECLMTGRYPHRNGATGFYPVRQSVPTLQESLKAAGYHLGILGKVNHLQPPPKFPWDFKVNVEKLGMGRDPARYFQYTKQFLEEAKTAKKPFFLMANSHDPHRPWAGSAQEKPRAKAGRKSTAGETDASTENRGDAPYPPPRRTYRPQEVAVPGFLSNLPDVRRETAQYYSSAHRCDQTVGEVLRALEESGFAENTLVMFLSDNGISLPFAKSNCYLASTRTPWLARWPGKIKPNTVDDQHFISGIDYMPTILEAAGLAPPDGMDGRSFLPLLTGGRQPERDRVFTCYNDTSGRQSYPMRCLQTRQFGYIYNAWSDGKTTYRSEPMNGLSFKAMQRAAETQPPVAERVELLLHRVPEELYDFQADPSALRNLVSEEKHRDHVQKMRKEMLAWMEQTQDPLLNMFRKRIHEERSGQN